MSSFRYQHHAFLWWDISRYIDDQGVGPLSVWTQPCTAKVLSTVFSMYMECIKIKIKHVKKVY